jgi:Protein of unknown function (DUF1642)
MTDKAQVARVTLPREVAEAIETLKQQGYTEYGIVTLADDNADLCGGEEKLIHDYVNENFYENSVKLMSALVNGYEIEKSPEDKVRDYYEGLIETKTDSLNDPYTRELAAYEASAVVKTLNLLEIKIPGVNADA